MTMREASAQHAGIFPCAISGILLITIRIEVPLIASTPGFFYVTKSCRTLHIQSEPSLTK